MKKSIIALALCSGLMLGSCATIMNGSSTDVNITSFPESDVTITDVNKNTVVYSGKTPVNVKLDNSSGYFRSAAYKLHFKSPDGLERSYVVRSKLHGAYWGNIIFGGPIGMLIIDPATGAMYYFPKQMKFDLVNDKNFEVDVPVSSRNIKSIDELTAEQRAQLVPVPQGLFTLEEVKN